MGKKKKSLITKHHIFNFCSDFDVLRKCQTGTTAISSCVLWNIFAPNGCGDGKGLAGQGRGLGEAVSLVWGWVWGHTKLHTVILARPCPVTGLAEPCWEGSMKWWSKWVSLMHNSWAERNLCTRQDHLLNISLMDGCLLAPHKIHLTPQCLNGSSTSLAHYPKTMPRPFFERQVGNLGYRVQSIRTSSSSSSKDTRRAANNHLLFQDGLVVSWGWGWGLYSLLNILCSRTNQTDLSQYWLTETL